ncbi:RidA family protein [Phyllobacterium zundukense]|uniref:Enamine deaminase RidA n=1 Tax=Phyllobacterium zundukense TaxID=1867719 RepID=A0A2N9W114_9HYPH|nr:RidA family protein [Phyllobacterium zundukense]ATU90494.1 enamine deaminase RidA [Phyllobacterium zundukense]PIO45432.1 enamine deaminase RidA [Phyllobacterium zundukense]
MKRITHNPVDGIYAATPDYVHALEISRPERIVYLSGTMGLDATGAAGRNVAEQLELVWANIRTILASAGMTVANIVRVTSYLRDAAFATENQNARVAALQGNIVPTTAIVVQTLSAEWLVELEIIAAA